MPPSIAILHYHLRPGGVTRVIEHAADALQRAGASVAVLAGPDASVPDNFPAPVRLIPGLGYDADPPPANPAHLAAEIQSAAADALGTPPDLYHAHNHSLGKNLALPLALRRLAEDRRPLLLQLHDFAEDGRPANYRRLLQHLGQNNPQTLSQSLYPLADHIHYATLNHRDATHHTAAGLPQSPAHALPQRHTHTLPNPVQLTPPKPEDERSESSGSGSSQNLILYPTRAIRRKNLGELLLWAALADENTRFATTLAPTNPDHFPVYRRWVAFARQHRLPVDFEIGSHSHASFTSLLRSARALITTSVAEGFGLAFLEPFLVDRPLLGRDLPDITADFKNAGINLAPLYDRLGVPVQWIGQDELRQRIEAALLKTYHAYGRSCGGDEVDRAMDAAVLDGLADFASLDEPLQEKVITHITRYPSAAADLSPPVLTGRGGDTDAAIRHNQHIIREKFSVERYGQRLMAIYQQLLGSPIGPVEGLSADRLLDQFLRPESFRLLKS